VSRVQHPHQCIIGHFGDKSFQSITCTGTDNLTATNKKERGKHKISQHNQLAPSEHTEPDAEKEPMIRQTTDRASFGRLLRHPASMWISDVL